MRIAVTYDSMTGEVFQHFGHTEAFKIYDVENNAVVSQQVSDTNGSGHGALAGLLKALNVNVLICGGIGGGAKNALLENGIEFFAGVTGNADQKVSEFLSGTLSFQQDVTCNHHEHEEGHTCGDHGCGSHSCGHHE